MKIIEVSTFDEGLQHCEWLSDKLRAGEVNDELLQNKDGSGESLIIFTEDGKTVQVVHVLPRNQGESR